MKTLYFISIIAFTLSCSHQNTNFETSREPSSIQSNIIYSPKLIGFIFLGNTNTHKIDISSNDFILKDDLERISLNKEFSPIGDFFLKPGTIIKLSKDTFLYTKPATRIHGLDLNSQVHLKSGTKIRVLQYNENSLTQTTATVEVIY